MKGSKPAGQTTQTQINPTQQMQAPFLQGGWNSALDLYNNNKTSYYPDPTLANWRGPDPLLNSGYQGIYNAGQNVGASLPAYNANYQSIGQYTPQIADWARKAAGNDNPALNSLMEVAQGRGAGMEQLAKAAGGYYLNKNPYLDAAIKAAQDPTQRAYQTSIAPSMDAALTSSGRYGSGAQAGLYDTSQRNLGRALGDVATNISSADYGRERQLQDEAARGYVSGQTAAGTAGGDLYNRGLSTGISGLNVATDIQRAMTALFPQWAAAQGLPAQAEVQAGQGLTGIGQQYQTREQAQIEDQKARFYGNQQAPYDTLSRYLESIGAKNPVSGTRQDSSPYFQNQASSMLSAGLGLTGIGKNLGLFGGASGGLGGLGGMSAADISGLLGEPLVADASASFLPELFALAMV